MKMDFLAHAGACVAAFTLIGCGQSQSLSDGLVADSDACSGQAIPNQFIVKHFDGSIEVIHAASEEAFVTGYLHDHAGQFQYAERDHKVYAAAGTRRQAKDVSPTQPTVTSADNWGPIKVDVGTLWSQNIRGSGVIVAVVDSGMDILHPQLQNQVYINPGESGTDAQGHPKQSNGIDDDANGYIDDYVGYDFYGNKPLAGDYEVHGTHVSGIIGAYHTDTTPAAQSYVEGMAPGVKLMPLAFLGSDGSGAMSDAVRAIQYAVAGGAKVINASWGGTQCSQSLKDEISALAGKGVIFVAAAGNDSEDVDTNLEYPASLNAASQFTVGSSGSFDFMSEFSNYGATTVHIFAPGENITSTIPGGMGVLSGTSMATPFVTGAIALLLSAEPSATPAQIRSALYGSALHNTQYVNASQGRLDLVQALTLLKAAIGN